MTAIILTISTLSSFICMELASWFIHKYVMHGPLWNIHKTHHQPNEHGIELNDAFAIFFAAIAAALLYTGMGKGNMVMTGAGAGITLYGLIYFILHDIFIHKRIRLFKRTNNPLLNALAEAHRDHHKSRSRSHSTSYGLLLINIKYYKKHYRKRKNT